MSLSEEIPKKMKDIPAHIIKVLTSGSYTSITKAIREAVSNSYDGGADNVKIMINPQDWFSRRGNELVIQIVDDGNGMCGDDFYEKFVSIGVTNKDPSVKNTQTERFPIGKFGIGALAFVPFVKQYTIFSKSYNEKPIKCIIDAEKIMIPSEKSYNDHILDNVNGTYISDEEWKIINSGSEDTGTIIIINGVTEEVYQQLLYGSNKFKEMKAKRGEECSVFEDVVHLTEGLKEIAWDLSTILPIDYNKNNPTYKSYKKYLKSDNPPIIIFFCGVELKRELFSVEGCEITPFEYDEGNVKAKGIIIGNCKPVNPIMANGIILRLNNVGIGGYQFFGFHFSNPPAQSRISGEIQILKGLHDELKADRETFRDFGEEFFKFNEHLQKELEKSTKSAKDLEAPTRKAKKEEKTISEKERRKDLIKKQKQQEKEEEGQKNNEKRVKKNKKESDNKDTKKEETLEKTKAEQQSKEVEKKDPILNIKVTTGELTLDLKHDIFKAYDKKYERKTIGDVLFVLRKLVDIPDELYFKIIDFLIEFKKKGDK